MAKYQVIAGVHVEHGRKYKAGDVLSHPHNLVETYKNKFIRVDDATPVTKNVEKFEIGANTAPAEEQDLPAPRPALAPPKRTKTVPEAPEAAPGVAAPENDQDAGNLNKPAGVEVTAQFPKATEEQYKVYKSGGTYFVYDDDDLSKPLNADGVNKAGVDKVISDTLEKA